MPDTTDAIHSLSLTSEGTHYTVYHLHQKAHNTQFITYIRRHTLHSLSLTSEGTQYTVYHLHQKAHNTQFITYIRSTQYTVYHLHQKAHNTQFITYIRRHTNHSLSLTSEGTQYPLTISTVTVSHTCCLLPLV